MNTIHLCWCLWHHPTGMRLQAVQHSYLPANRVGAVGKSQACWMENAQFVVHFQSCNCTYALYVLTTLTYIELEHVQWSCISIANQVGAVDKLQACWTENALFVALVSLVQQFKAYRKQLFTDIYQFGVFTACTDAWNSRSGDFRTVHKCYRFNKLITLPLVHACGVISTPWKFCHHMVLQ